jgi:hypothetical protein
LDCSGNQLVTLDLSTNTAITSLHCSQNQLTVLDLSANTTLWGLDCSFNPLNVLTPSNSIRSLSCENTLLTILDLSGCTALDILYCPSNQLTTLKLGTNVLEMLECSNNQLTVLDLSNNPKLWHVECDNNRLIDVNMSNNKRLWELYCGNNQLTNLDLRDAGTELEFLYCPNNQLIELDLSANTYLRGLNCSGNQLTNLDLSANEELVYLYCSDNQLTTLDLSANKMLQVLNCFNNRLPLSELFEASKFGFYNKKLGTQNLLPKKAGISQTLFSEQSVFNAIYTDYVVTKTGVPAPTSDYTVIDGKLIFNTVGEYTVTMTNDAIVSHPDYPAEVVVDIEVGETGIDEVSGDLSGIVVYPNPTRGELIVNSYELIVMSVEVFDIFGRRQKAESRKDNVCDISHLPTGMYFVRITTDAGVVVRKIVKQ